MRTYIKYKSLLALSNRLYKEKGIVAAVQQMKPGCKIFVITDEKIDTHRFYVNHEAWDFLEGLRK